MLTIRPQRLRPIAATGALALMFAFTGCGGEDGASEGGAAGRDKVTVQLDFQVRGNHGMFYVAKEKGYFEEEGIDVEEIRTGTGSPDALRLVGGGGAEFGFADLPSLVTARSQTAPVVALAAVNQRSPLGMCSKADRHTLNTPADLKGLSFGAHTAGSTYIFYKALLAANGIDPSELTERTVTPPFESFLFQDRVDVVACYIDAEVPELEAKAGGEGSLSILRGADNGYDVYGSGLFTSEKMIAEAPELVQRFTNAYMRAFDFVIDQPEETAKILADAQPQLAGKEDVFVEQIQADIDQTFTSELTKREGLGAMDPQVWRETIDTLAKQGVIENAPEVDSVYDGRFIEKATQAGG